MAAPIKNRTKPTDPLFQKTRDKIQTSQLVNRLQNNALGELPEELSAGAIQSIKILLDKSIPNLQNITLAGDEDNPIHVSAIIRKII